MFYFFCDEPNSCCVLFRFCFHFVFRTNRLFIIVLRVLFHIEMDAFIPLTARVFSFLFSLICRTNEWKSLLKFNERNFSFVSALSVCVCVWIDQIGFRLTCVVCLCIYTLGIVCVSVCVCECVFSCFSCKIFCDCFGDGVWWCGIGVGGLFLLQLIPFFILVFLHQTMGRSAELLCLVRHAFGTIF